MAIRKTPIYEEELFPPYFAQYASGSGTTTNGGEFSVTLSFTPKICFFHIPQHGDIYVGHQLSDPIPCKPSYSVSLVGFQASVNGQGNTNESLDNNQTGLCAPGDGNTCFCNGKTIYVCAGSGSASIRYNVTWQAWG